MKGSRKQAQLKRKTETLSQYEQPFYGTQCAPGVDFLTLILCACDYAENRAEKEKRAFTVYGSRATRKVWVIPDGDLLPNGAVADSWRTYRPAKK